MAFYRADLHTHTVLSPCASREMLPAAIVATALRRNIRILAITDHNQTANISAVAVAAQGSELLVVPGMELQTCEGLHLLCLFETLEQAHTLQVTVDRHLPDLRNDPDRLGEQQLVEPSGRVVASEKRMLIASADISLHKAVAIVHQIGGLAIPAHVDRQGFGLLSALGTFPPDVPFDAIEVSRRSRPEDILAIPSYPEGVPVVVNGDSHQLSDILGKCIYEMPTASFHGLSQALRGVNQCSVKIAD